MNRQTGYRGQLPYETDFLYNGRFAYEGLGLLAMDLLGTSTLVAGCACTATSPASLAVKVAPGRIYSVQNLDDSDWGVANNVGGLAADTNVDHRILKQGLLRDTTQIAIAAPGTVGQSINYLVQAQFQTSDAGNTVLPFFNSAAPDVPWAGPGNSGGALPTYRKDSLVLSTKTGAAAATGSQVTPAPDAGCVGLWVITVAQGQATITAGNISAYGAAPFLTENLTQKISQASGDARYLRLTNSRIRLTADTTFYVSTAGNDATGDGTAGNPWRTAQKASDVLQRNYDLNGYVATILRAASTAYTDPVLVNGPYVGAKGPSSVVFDGGGMANTTVTSSVSGIACYQAQYGAQFTVQNQKLAQTGGSSGAIVSYFTGSAVNYGNIDFAGGNASSNHLSSITLGTLTCIGNCTISGAATAHCGMDGGSMWTCNNFTYTIFGTPAWGNAFVYARENAMVFSSGMTFSGSSTGQRYSASANGVIQTGGGGASYFPGNSSGAATAGGQYS